ncbi:MAG: YdbH domain-containing protein [Rhodospirillaceae bacterium]|nr:YdbH domain-containing protein [Rhodospirillaceae bacterium]
MNLPPRYPARRRWWYWPVGALGLLILVLIAGYVALPTIAARWAEGWLADHGAPNADLEIGSLGRYSAFIDMVSLGDEPGDATARQITIDYSLGGLAQPAIGRVTIAELHLAIDPSDETRPLGVLSDLIASLAGSGPDDGDGDGNTDAAIPPITIESATIELPTILSGAEVHLSGQVAPSGQDRIVADMDVALTASDAALSGTFHVESDLDGTGRMQLVVDDGTGRLGGELGIEIAAASGAVNLAFTNMTDLTGTIDLAIAELRSANWPSAALRVSGELDGESWAAHIATDGPAAGLDGSIDIEAPQLAPDNIKVAANLTLEAGAPWWALLGFPTPTAGVVTIDADGDIAAGETSALSSTALPAGALTVTVSMDGMNWPGRLTALDALGAVDTSIQDGGVLLTASSPILIDATPDPEWLTGLGAGTIGITDPGPLSLEIQPGANASWQPVDGGSLDIAGAVTVTATGANPLDANVVGNLHFAPISELQSFEVTELDIRTGNLAFDQDGLRASIGDFSALGTASGKPEDWTSELLLAGGLAISGNGFRIEGFDFELPALIRQVGSALTVHGTDRGTMTLLHPSIGDMPYRIDRIRARLAQIEEPLLVRNCPTPETCTLDYRLRLTTDGIAAHTEAVTDAIALGPTTLQLEGSVAPDGSNTSTIVLDAASLSMPEWSANADDLRLYATLSPGGIAFEGSVANLGGADLAAWLPPLTARFTGSVAGSTVNFDAHLADENEWVVSNVSGTHRIDDNSGTASLTMEPIQFRPGGLQPWDIAPALAVELDEATGQVSLGGGLAWNQGHIGSDLILRLEELSIIAPEAELARINGAIALASLVPLVSQPDQQISIALIDIGVPLTDAVVTFSIEEGPLFAIEHARFNLAGGTVETAPVVIDPMNPDTTIELHVANMNLAAFLAMAEVDGLVATGELNGTIPVEIRGDDIVITTGRLDAEEPGALQYAPAEPPAALQGAGETASLVLGALANFRYDQLWLTLDRDADGETGLGLHVRGSNPDFYDGYPIELNLTLTGELDRILRDSLVGYRIPDYVKDQLENGETVETEPDINAGDSQ